MKFSNFLILLTAFLLLYGCSTRTTVSEGYYPPAEPDDFSIWEVRCIERYKVALSECEYFLSYEPDYYVKDRLMKKCLSNKGFSLGIDTCSKSNYMIIKGR